MSNEKDIAPIVVDLGVNRRGEINESWLAQFGGAIKMILQRMFGGDFVPVSVRGNRREIDQFANALQKEKNYIKSLNSYGLNDLKTYRSKSDLKNAISKFERGTGIKWPFK
jgi:hypothetical protein